MSHFEVVRGTLPLPIVLSCDHARGRIPEDLGRLGLSLEEIAACAGGMDIGAEQLFDYLVESIDCFGIKNYLSRLVIDMNRYIDQPGLIQPTWAGCPVAGNLEITPRERQRRIETYYCPYHDALDSLLLECERRHGVTYYFSVHTMASEFAGEVRKMDFSLVCNAGCPLSPSLGEILEARGFFVAVNDPYTLERDVVRVPTGDELERFNQRAVLIEMNERFAGDATVMEAVSCAVRETVEAYWKRP